jgi:uncharacterized protein (DUF2062 family)
MVPAALIAMRFRANVPFAMAACWITNPVTAGPALFGQFVLGHASTLNSVSYREPSGLIYEAVTTLPQPDCFCVG